MTSMRLSEYHSGTGPLHSSHRPRSYSSALSRTHRVRASSSHTALTHPTRTFASHVYTCLSAPELVHMCGSRCSLSLSLATVCMSVCPPNFLPVFLSFVCEAFSVLICCRTSSVSLLRTGFYFFHEHHPCSEGRFDGISVLLTRNAESHDVILLALCIRVSPNDITSIPY